MPKKQECPWCEFNGGVCSAGEECEFKTLPYEKEAILQRIVLENKLIVELQDGMAEKELSNDELDRRLSVIIDKVKGLQIMVDRLMADFGMTDSEIRSKYFKQSKSSVSFVKRMLLAKRLMALKEQRGGKRK